MTNFEHGTGNLHEKMIKNVSEALNIVLAQNYFQDVTNNSELEEADQNSPERFESRKGKHSWENNEQFCTIFGNYY